jgi:hypothetical protein
MKQIQLSEVQNDLLKFLELAQEEDVIVMNDDQPIGYLVGFADEDDWIDYLMLNDPKFQKRLHRSIQDIREGRTVPFEQVKITQENET